MIEKPHTIERFNEDLDNAFQGIRGALTELLISVNADIQRPQEIARRFGLNKNLAWKLSKIVTITDPHAVVTNLPGPAGMKTILSAFKSHGASPTHLDNARQMIDRFDRVVELHVGDRSTLELVLSSNSPERVPTENLHKTRKMSFQGNSSIWGIQARVRMASFFIAPNADDPTMIDTASLGGLIDVRRLRSYSSVPLLMRFAYNDDGSLMDSPSVEPIDPERTDDDLKLIPEFCSSPLPEFVPIESRGYTRYQLAPGPIGNGGQNTWVYGELIRQFAPIYSDPQNTFGEHSAPVQVPVEWLLCDLQVHRDLAFAMSPRAILYSQLATGPGPERDTDLNCDRLPIAEEIEPIGQGPPVVATPLIPDYPLMVQRTYDRMGWQAEEFHGFRIVMKYPPMPSAMIIQHDLKAR